MLTVTIRPPDLESVAQWDDLVLRAPVNVFMNPVALKAAAETGLARIHVVQVWDNAVTPARLAGVWALQERRPLPLLPAVLEALPYNYSFLSRPVIDPAYVDRAMPAMLAAIRDDASLPNVIAVKEMDGEAQAYLALKNALEAGKQASCVLAEYVRPVVSRQFGVKSSGSTRKKLRQDWNRLSSVGALQMVNDRAPERVREAFEIFLQLEMASWKGANGTALLCDSADAAFVRRLIGGLAEQGNASVALLQLDGRAIAAQTVLYCGTTAYTWKIGFDEAYAKYSPGILLIDRLTEELFASGPIEAIDSCSAEGSFMNQLWAGRRAMVDLVVDVGAGRSPAFLLEAGRQTAYRELKLLRNRLRALATRSRPAKKHRAAA
jgi:CelD/BcsL family acetyltransferase involved in cellulose biosynthesis